MELGRQIALARKWLPLLVAGPLLAAGVAFLYTSNQPEVHQVSAHLLPEQLLPTGNPNYASAPVSRLVVLTTNYAFLAKSRELLSGLSPEVTHGASIENLIKRVDAVVDADTAGLTITARAGSPETSAALANAVAHAIEAKSSAGSSDQNLIADLETARKRLLEAEAEYQRLMALPAPRKAADDLALANSLGLLHELTSVYDSLNASLASAPGGLMVVDEAAPQRAVQTAPLTLYYTLLAAIAGFLIAAAIAAVVEYLDDRIRDPEAVQEVAGSPPLGTVPRMRGPRDPSDVRRLITLHSPRSAAAEAYRTLRTNIEFASIDGSLKTLLVTSSVPGEGKTVTAANLAVVFAQAGRRVLLVDADLRKPGAHRMFDLPNSEGLTTLVGGNKATLDGVARPTEEPNLRVVTSGPLPPKPAELMGSQRMLAVLEQLKSGADLLIFDSSPLLVVSDSVILSSFLDGTVLVIDAGRSRERAVRQARDALKNAGANVLGIVLNRVPGGIHASYHQYYGGPEESIGIMERLVHETEKPPTA